MKVADLIIHCLETEGVEYVFGIPGEETADLVFALEHSQIKFIPTRHEQGAAFMADLYGRVSGKAGVCLSTLGPGATNLLTGVADAYLDKAPVVAITGQADTMRIHKESHQLLDVVNLFRPVTKWNASIQNPKITTEVVRKAFKWAEMEKPGPTHFELPEDIAALECNLSPIPPKRLRRPAPDYKTIAEAIDILNQAEVPVILAGNGAIRKRASKHLRELVDRTDIPVVSTFMGKGALDDRDEHSLYTIGIAGKDYPMCAVDRADVVLTIGYDIGEYAPEHWNPEKNKTIIHIDFNSAEVYEYYQPQVEIIADISASLWELNKAVERQQLKFHPTWFKSLRKSIHEDFESYRLKAGEPFTVPGVLLIIRELLDAGDILISDVGSHKMWIGRNYPVYEPNSALVSNGLASMAVALPGGIGAKLAKPDHKVVTAMGDGGFLMNSQEIETAKRIGVGFPILVFNDNDYGLIRWKQQSRAGKSFGTELTNPDYRRYAESFGIEGYSPQSVAELTHVLEDTINRQALALVEIPIDPRVNYELSQKLNKNICERFEFPPLADGKEH